MCIRDSQNPVERMWFYGAIDLIFFAKESSRLIGSIDIARILKLCKRIRQTNCVNRKQQILERMSWNETRKLLFAVCGGHNYYIFLRLHTSIEGIGVSGGHWSMFSSLSVDNSHYFDSSAAAGSPTSAGSRSFIIARASKLPALWSYLMTCSSVPLFARPMCSSLAAIWPKSSTSTLTISSPSKFTSLRLTFGVLRCFWN